MAKIVDFFSNCRVRSKLTALITLFLINLIILGSVVNLLLKSSQTITIVTSEHRVFNENRSLGIEHFYSYKIGGDPQDLEKAQAYFAKAFSISNTFAVIDSILANSTHDEWIGPVYDIFKEGVGYDIKKVELMADQIQFFSKISPGKMAQAQVVSLQAAQKVKRIMELIDALGNEISDEEFAGLQQEFANVNELSELFTSKIFALGNLLQKVYFLIITILILALGAVATFFSIKIANSIAHPINKLADNFKQIASGNLQSSVNIQSNNEIGDLSKAFSKIQLGLLDIVEYSKKVANGDFSAKLTPKSDADELTLALNRMADDLKKAKQKTEKETWIQQGKNRLEDEIRGNPTVRELSAKIIGFLSEFLGFEMGAVYVYDDVLEHLEFTGSIGLNKEEVQKFVKPGEDGLIGRAALQKTLQIIDTTGKYQKINSATGEIKPEKLYLLPLHTQSGLKAVFEFAAIKPLDELQVEFLTAVSEQVSVNLKAAVARFRNSELLDKTLEQSEILKQREDELKSTNEELKSQEEELRVANEELAEHTKILRESEKSLQVQQEELKVTNEELEVKTKLLEQQKNDIAEKNEHLEKTQQELVQKANELQQASQYKSEFLANMSHELRTPLNSLLILSKLLGDNKDGNLTADQVKSANIIHKSGKDLLELISEILDLSKIEAGKMNFDFNDIPSESIKNELAQSFMPVAENKGLSLTVKMAPVFPEMLFTDQQRLLQILKNILSNAFKFTFSGGIEINFGIPEPGTLFSKPFLNSNNSCFIAVSDTGVGIPKDKLDFIFEAFQQADGSISRKFGGTGLGLSISRELIRVLGGEIKVESTEDHGSTFTLFLPTDPRLVGYSTIKKPEQIEVIAPENANSKAVSKEEEAGQKRQPKSDQAEIPYFIADDRENPDLKTLVLIIHSEKNTAEELLAQCRKINFKAVVAKTIADGIVLAEKFRPKAIIVSAALKSPGEYDKLKNSKSTAKLPVHQVSILEENMLEELEELVTPETDAAQNYAGSVERKLTTEFRHVLVVEDDPVAQHAIHQLFRNKDIIVHEAKTGMQAYEMISAKPFDCVILDLGLPDFSGHELLEKLKSDGITIPNVIIHTARELLPSEIRELNNYSDSIVIKGVKSDERLMDEVSLFLHQVAKKIPKTASFSTVQTDSKTSVFKGKKILLVDDDIRNIFALAQILEEKEIEILEAENGQVAIDVLEKNPDIDLVLMDIMMPVLDGYKAMKKIRLTPEIAHVPIITLTAKAMKEDFQKAIDSGANDYISKPVDIDKLFELLKIWLFR